MTDPESRGIIVKEVDEGIAKRVRAAAAMNPGREADAIAETVARYLSGYVAQREGTDPPDVTVVVREEGPGLYNVAFKIQVPEEGTEKG